MTGFCVWAPQAQEVRLLLAGQPVARGTPMQAGHDGWFSLDVAHSGPGTAYAFALDGGDPLPDPRSAWQPEGIDRPSRVVDHSAYAWADTDWRGASLEWIAAGAIYELHIGTFTPAGTFAAAADRLDHLVALGVRAVEIMPVNEFSGDHGWGYDGVFLYAPHHSYGSPDDLKALVEACHARGLAVILDVVYNHLGPCGNVLERYGPYFTTRYATPWGKAVNLDGPGSDHVRRFFIDDALMWLRDYHLDALRVDAVHAIVDLSAVHFLEQLAAEVAELAGRVGRPLSLIAESDLNDPRVVRPPAVGGHGLDAVWNEDFHHALHSLLTGEREGYYQDFGSIEAVSRCLERGVHYDGRYSAFRRRRHGRPHDGLGGRTFVGFLQNHDQVGNRAVGERSAALMSPGRLKIGAALVLTAPFTPMLFMGEEWAASTPFLYFTAHHDPGLGAAVRDGRRREFAAFGFDPQTVPDPQDPTTFERSRLAWDEVGEGFHAEMLRWHRDLLALRTRFAALTDDRLDRVQVTFSEEERWLRVRRGRGELIVNLASAEATLPLRAGAELLLVSHNQVAVRPAGLALPSESVAVVSLPT